MAAAAEQQQKDNSHAEAEQPWSWSYVPRDQRQPGGGALGGAWGGNHPRAVRSQCSRHPLGSVAGISGAGPHGLSGVADSSNATCRMNPVVIIIIIEGLSLLQSIPPTTANKQTQAQQQKGEKGQYNIILYGMAVGCCELRLRSTPRYRLVCICFPTPGRGLPYGSGLGLTRCLGPGECLHSFIQAQSSHQ